MFKTRVWIATNKKTAPVKKTGAVELYLLTHRK